MCSCEKQDFGGRDSFGCFIKNRSHFSFSTKLFKPLMKKIIQLSTPIRLPWAGRGISLPNRPQNL